MINSEKFEYIYTQKHMYLFMCRHSNSYNIALVSDRVVPVWHGAITIVSLLGAQVFKDIVRIFLISFYLHIHNCNWIDIR